MELIYHDGKVLRSTRPTVAEHDQDLVNMLRALPAGSLGNVAVLCPSMRAKSHYQRLLTQAGLPLCLLEHYDGRPVEAVKLGSYRRAKGLEFKYVCLPRHDEQVNARSGLSETASERQQLARSRLFVAMTRGRDVLGLGGVSSDAQGPPQ
ncbi:hypothetical protein [Streptomyces sp. NPDC094472]|uniref:hypothetical protein n=1 Tax=unclassified Streptomyces TaxID=2593676 RepID=UPI00332486B2